jgi:hypothetical protein
MGNRAAVIFQDPREPQDAKGVYLHWNGGPESIYAFAKQLASYNASQNPDFAGRNIPPGSMCARFIQLTANYFSAVKSDFLHVCVLAQDEIDPAVCGVDSNNDIYVIRPDFSIERWRQMPGASNEPFSDDERLEEFASVLEHPYWTDEESIFKSVREANDHAFLRGYRQDAIEHVLAVLPAETELARRRAIPGAAAMAA